MPCLDEATFMALLAGGLPPERSAEVDAHLDTCPSCRRLMVEALRAQTPTGAGNAEPTPLRVPRDAPRAEPLLPKGTAVGRYLVLEKLGTGGMGVVYAAYDPELNRRVALKLLRASALGLEAEEGRQHLLREAQAMACVSHPNVVPVYDVGTFGSEVFLAMELVEAQTLREWLKASPRGWRQVHTCFLDAGRGLAAAHAAGVVHGDFKLDNLLMARDGRPRVTDFGLARRATPEALEEPRVELATVAGGTPAYMAPELFTPGARADARSDQFAFCVALHEALYGERPFAGTTVQELVTEVRAGQVRPAPKGTRVPPWLRRVLLRGLSVAPEARYPSVEALLSALQEDPGVRKRRVLQVSAGLTLLAAAVGLTHVVHVSGARRCGEARRELASVWDEARQQVVREAFLATRQPFAPTAWEGVRRGLDAYAAAWVTTRTTACEATHVRGEQSEEVLAARMRCLDGQLAGMAALTELFSQADSGVVEQSLRALGRLPAPTECSNPVTASVSTDPAARERAEALERTLAQARALQSAGRYEQARALVEPAAQRAQATGARSGSADAFVLLAELRDNLGDPPGAEEALFTALGDAEAVRNDDAAARAWIHLVSVSGVQREQYALGHRWKALAEAALERLGGNRDSLRAELLTHTGSLLFWQARYPEAVAKQEAALALVEKVHGADSLEASDVLLELGTTRSTEGEVEKAIAHLERAVSLRQRALGPEHPEVAKARLSLAEAYWQKQDVPTTERLAREALQVIERTLGPEHALMGNGLNTLAAALHVQGHMDEALPVYERALRISERVHGLDSTDTAYLINNVAVLLAQQGRLDEALARLEQVRVNVEKKLGADHPTMAWTLRQIGRAKLRQKRAREALPDFQRAAEIQLALKEDVRSEWTATLSDLGLGYLRSGMPREALAPLEKAVAGWEHARPRPVEPANARFLLGWALWESGGDRTRALRLIAEARQQAQALGPEGGQLQKEVEVWLGRNGTPRLPEVAPPTR
jgi:tetratricopeptide (TPR) repeat protein